MSVDLDEVCLSRAARDAARKSIGTVQGERRGNIQLKDFATREVQKLGSGSEGRRAYVNDGPIVSEGGFRFFWLTIKGIVTVYGLDGDELVTLPMIW